MKHRQRTPEYNSWDHMIQRCSNPRCNAYPDYGGRGIKVCEAWKDFRAFFADMGPRPPDLTLDRKDNNGNYELGNCRWTTRKEQQNNRRSNSHGPTRQYWFYGHGPNGEMIIENNQCHVARIFKLNQRHINECLHGKYKQHKGWNFKGLTYLSINVKVPDRGKTLC